MDALLFASFTKLVLVHEGGLSLNPRDPGGATNYGISLRYLKAMGLLGDIDHDGDVDIDDIRALTPELTLPFYKSSFYNPMRIGDFTNAALAIQVYDFGVNAGCYRAIKTLQQLLKIEPDGKMGPNTIHFTNLADWQSFPTLYRMEREDFYRLLVKKKPSLEEFLKGWINRAEHCIIKP